MKLLRLLPLLFILLTQTSRAAYILIPMDETQKDHLKSYGLTYWVLKQGDEAEWWVNYRGGSFILKNQSNYENECKIRGISYEIISDAKHDVTITEITNPETNMDAVKLLKAPKVAVYSPKSAQPWDDAVTLVLNYAEIPYDVVYDEEVLQGKLSLYDWLHLHHEDFTGQYGKFYAAYRDATWYRDQVKELEELAAKNGFGKVSQLKLAVSKKIRDFALGGGFLFAMCSATDSYDIALAADGVDICESMFDGDPADPRAQQKLNFNNTFAFENFTIEKSPYVYEFSDIDVQPYERRVQEQDDYFTLFEFSAKTDLIPTLLTQNHTQIIKGFMGQTTAFKNKTIKSNVLVLGEAKKLNEARYIHGTLEKGFFTFYGGHDPEDYQHMVGEPPTDMALHPNSPGYRLILNNILFPSAKKKKQKT